MCYNIKFKNFTVHASKSKIAVADENLSVIHYYKNGKVTKTECLDLLPF